MPPLHVNNVSLIDNQMSKLTALFKVTYLCADSRWINGLVSRLLADHFIDSLESWCGATSPSAEVFLSSLSLSLIHYS